MCVSDAKLEKAILRCNGYEKIKSLLSDRNLFIWTDNQIEQYVDKNLFYLGVQDVEELKRLGSSCKNAPGFYHLAYILTHECEDKQLSPHTLEQLNEYVASSSKTWEEFESSENI